MSLHEIRVPARLHGVLPAEGVCLRYGGRSGAHRGFSGNAGGAVRAALCLPDQEFVTVADAASYAMPFSAGGRLLDPSGEADAVPHLSVLAGAGGGQTGMAEDRPLVSGHWQ